MNKHCEHPLCEHQGTKEVSVSVDAMHALDFQLSKLGSQSG